MYVPDEPFPHAMLVKNSKLKHFKHIYSEGFSTDFQEVSSFIEKVILVFFSIFLLDF